MLEDSQLVVKVRDRVDATTGVGTTSDQVRAQDHDPCNGDDDHEDHGHQLLDLLCREKL
jgi:hypothetical protein